MVLHYKREDWRSVLTPDGVQFAKMPGEAVIPEWFADNLDTKKTVSIIDLDRS